MCSPCDCDDHHHALECHGCPVLYVFFAGSYDINLIQIVSPPSYRSGITFIIIVIAFIVIKQSISHKELTYEHCQPAMETTVVLFKTKGSSGPQQVMKLAYLCMQCDEHLSEVHNADFDESQVSDVKAPCASSCLLQRYCYLFQAVILAVPACLLRGH